MSERPIIFSTPALEAILAQEKTQTRRIVKPQPDWVPHGGRLAFDDAVNRGIRCPYGQPGDTLWVRETWRLAKINGDSPGNFIDVQFKAGFGVLGYRKDWREFYAGLAANEAWSGPTPTGHRWGRWRPSIHMPRWTARLFLRVEEVRAQRIHEISFSDIRAEGIECPEHDFPGGFCSSPCAALEEAFVTAWDAMNAKRGHPWRSNPWVWVVTFSRLEESP